MSWISILIRSIPFVLMLIELAEKAFDGVPESGVEKKQMVMQAFQAAFDVVVGDSTGGQKETWERLEPIISKFVDIACDFLFGSEDK